MSAASAARRGRSTAAASTASRSSASRRTTLPEPLHWFKWEAYWTWLSGFALFTVLYYLQPHTYLIDPSVAKLSSAEAIGASIGLLVVAWLVYDALCRTVAKRSEAALAVCMLALVTRHRVRRDASVRRRAPPTCRSAPCSGRSWSANVFFVIIPAHWELVRAKEAGREPDPAANARGKQRSIHNNYLTLPVLFAMLSNHFSFTYGHESSWAILVCLMVIGAWVRHYFNLRHRGRTLWWIPVTAALALAGVAVWIRPSSSPAASRSSAHVPFAVAHAIVAQRCAVCHSAAADRARVLRAAEGDRVRHAAGDQGAGAADPAAGGRAADDAARQPDAHDAGRARLARRVDPARCEDPLMLEISAGGFDFVARFEEADAPQTVAAFRDAAAARVADHPCALERRGRLDPDGRPRSRARAGERDVLPEPGRDHLLPGGRQRDRDPARVRLRQLREQGGPARRQPLRDDRRGQREPPRARPEVPLGRRPADRLHERR